MSNFNTTADQTPIGFAAGSGTATTTVPPTARRAERRPNVSPRLRPLGPGDAVQQPLTQIDQLAGDSSYNGTNLIGGKGTNNNLTINFNAKATRTSRSRRPTRPRAAST